MREYVIDINGEINEELINRVVDELRGVYEYDKHLLNTYVDPSKDIFGTVTLSIDSPGGLVSGFTRIKTEIDKLKSLNIHIKAYVTNLAASTAFLITLCADERDGSEFCMLMNHVASCVNYGKVTANARMSEFNLEMESKYTDFIVDRTDIDREWLENSMEIDQWFCRDDAVELGIFTTGKDKEEDMTMYLSDIANELTMAGYKVIDDISNVKKVVLEETEETEDELEEKPKAKKVRKTKKSE